MTATTSASNHCQLPSSRTVLSITLASITGMASPLTCLAKNMGGKHCKYMTSLYSNMGKLPSAITLILRYESKFYSIKFLCNPFFSNLKSFFFKKQTHSGKRRSRNHDIVELNAYNRPVQCKQTAQRRLVTDCN